MKIYPPLEKVNITLTENGFYEGFNRIVTVCSKVLIGLLVVLAAVFPDKTAEILSAVTSWTFESFGAWYIYAVAFFITICFGVALHPKTGKIVLGKPGEKPEFSNFSWFSMMFGAGIGIGMLTFATAEPLYHFASNPDTIMGNVEGSTAAVIPSAYKWSFLHWGAGAWACYALVGMALAYFSYNKGQPLTIRSALAPLFGKKLDGTLGHIVDITGVIATVFGLSVTIGFGISQFAAGMYTMSGWDVLINSDGSPTVSAMLIALAIIMVGSIFSALSGVGKGIKWLSNINMVLSIALLLFFLIVGSTMAAVNNLFLGLWEYVSNWLSLTFTYWPKDEAEPGATLYKWQSVWWSVFYWAWWIAFAPFVGVFLARVSRGRTVREFVLGAILIPSLMCFIWFALLGGTAIDLELSGQAAGAILKAGQESQLYATLAVLVSEGLATFMTVVVVVLLFTYLVTSADSGILIINTINSGGNQSRSANKHIIIWGIGLGSLIAMLLLAGGMGSIKSAMLIGALPFSFIMVLMGISLVLDFYRSVKSGES